MHRRYQAYFYYFALFFLIGSTTTGCAGSKAKVNDPTDVREYVTSAKGRQTETKTGEGSLWMSSGYRSDLYRDFKARYVDDIVTIKVDESTQALASADASNSRDSKATAGAGNLFGLEKKVSELSSMVSGSSSSTFAGKGSTSRQTTLATTLTARIVDVLPNGYLVVEGMREIRVNNENQNVYLTGVVRPEDITPGNIVISSAVAQMSVRVQGRGTVSQPLKPGWLYRILCGILPF
jgi:flagellar L-ring protein FlgH